MVRWEPGAGQRLQSAALELYATKGFDETTVAEIAAAAGVTERTFFRHFADKREVIFGGQELFLQGFLDGVAAAPPELIPIRVVTSAVIAASDFFAADRRAFSRQRAAVIAANPDLRERELLKMATLSASIAAALRERDVPEPAATLAAECGVTAFRLAFEQWIAPGSERSLTELEVEIFDELAALNASSTRTHQ